MKPYDVLYEPYPHHWFHRNLATSLPKGILKFLRITSSNVGQRWLMRLPGSGNEIELRPAVSQQGRWYAYGQDGVRSGRGAESSPTQLHTSRGFSENLRRKMGYAVRWDHLIRRADGAGGKG